MDSQPIGRLLVPMFVYFCLWLSMPFSVALPVRDEDSKVSTLALLLPLADSMSVAAKPGWLTADDVVVGAATICVLLAGATGWSLTKAKKNMTVKILASELEQARRELAEAHQA